MSVYLPDRGARRWSVEVLSASHPVGLCFLAVLRFVHLTTNRRLFESPLGVGDALDRVPSWLARPQAVQTGTDASLQADPVGAAALVARGRRPDDGPHIVAYAIGHAGTLYSNDRDVGRFYDGVVYAGKVAG